MFNKIKVFWSSLDGGGKAIVLIGVIVVILYFIMSPYQNCKRNGGSGRGCISVTNW